jgi:large subunit ribosomal protein L21
MYAVIETGGKQYTVKKDDVIAVEKLMASGGDKIQFNKVLLTGGEKTVIGEPLVKGAGVQALVIEQVKAKKIVSFVKRRRKSSSKTKKGHRQQLTLIKITDILSNGAEKSEVKEAVSGKGLEVNYSELAKTSNKTKNVSAKKTIKVKEDKVIKAAVEKAEDKGIKMKEPATKKKVLAKTSSKAKKK